MKIKLITIPNLLTLTNLFCGAMAVVSALVWEDLSMAFWLIIAAAVCDFFDGFAARLLNQSSAIGVQLDSLADDISFGLAPATVLFALYAQAPDSGMLGDEILGVGRYVVFVVALFSALRLAKFNIDDTQHEEFEGLTTTANGIFCASLGWLVAAGEITLSKEIIILLSVVTSLLLVCPVRMFSLKFKGFGWRGNELRYSFMAFSAVLFALLLVKAIPLIIGFYVVVSIIRWINTRTKTRENARL